MAINISQIEENVEALLGNLSNENFIYDLLSAYGQPKASITRLRKGDYNLSKDNGMVLWKKKLCFKHEDQGDLHAKIDELSHDPKITKQHPRFIVVTDFKNLLAADTTTKDTLDIPIEKLNEHCDFFLPWAGMEKSKLQSENPADIKAAERMGRLYDLILEDNPIKNEDDRHALNIFFTRLLFCFFAEDTGIFPADKFTNGLASHTAEDGSDLKEYLEKLFEVLNVEDNSAYPSYFREFPYVNGGLFAHESPAPTFSRKSRKIIIECGALNWKAINPDIFGSMMQAVVHTDKRSGMGMHYTSVVNIMKVIEPLFLNDLYEELENAGEDEKKLRTLLNRIYNIRIVDPACGSGNFLIIAYKELCKLEIQIFKKIYGNQRAFRFESKLHLTQFYGIEIDDFAHETAKLSLWLAEHQMNIAFKEVFGDARPTLPLQDGGNIVCGNATRLDWNEIVSQSADKQTFIVGNPPYHGSKNQSPEQKKDLAEVFSGLKGHRSLDYIAAWFYKAALFTSRDHNSSYAFVTTNSICQGIQVALLWPKIFELNLEVAFANKKFQWTNSARGKAGVTCSIIGIRPTSTAPKYLYVDGSRAKVPQINAYLMNARNTIIAKHSSSIAGLARMQIGNEPYDSGYLIFKENEKNDFLNKWPEAEFLFKKLVGSSEFIKGTHRWCLWIEHQDLQTASQILGVQERIDKVRASRLKGGMNARSCADRPHQFRWVNRASHTQIVLPVVSSENRRYIPMGFMDRDTIISNKAQVIYDPDPFVFALLTSHLHMVWVRTITGRIRSDYQYTANICYNGFPVPDLDEDARNSLEELTFEILETREQFSELNLAQLYNEETMPGALREKHSELDAYVDKLYKPKGFENDNLRIDCLFSMYEAAISGTNQMELINA